MREYIEFFKVLSDETRFRIIMLLLEKDLAVCELVGILDLPQPKVSKALSKMRDLEIVRDTRKEKFIFYSINKNNIEYINILKEIKNSNIEILKEDMKRLTEKDFLTGCCSV